MPRSSLLNALMRVAADVQGAQQPAQPVRQSSESRQAGKDAGGRRDPEIYAPTIDPRLADVKVAIVGAGLAGLTAAYELSKAGLKPVVFEGNTRLGGRCRSIRFEDGQTAERGGEFINASQEAIWNLASELGLSIDDTYNEHDSWDERWRFTSPKKGGPNPTTAALSGRLNDEIYTRQQATTDYAKLHPVIQYQWEQIGADKGCSYRYSTPFARELDNMSLAEWVKLYVSGGRDSRLGQLIENALSEENAADPTSLSGLVPAQLFWVNQIPVKPPPNGYNDEFQLYYGLSSERFHIRYGNGQIPEILGEKLRHTIQTGMKLIAIVKVSEQKVKLSFSRDSSVWEDDYDRVILALPFTTLRNVNITAAGFSERKRHAIKTLGMGSSTKFQLRFHSRDVWNNDNTRCDGEIRLKSDLFQTTWDVTSARRHDRGSNHDGKGGMLCFWSGGSQAELAGRQDCYVLAKECLEAAEKVLPPLRDGTKLSDLWTGEMTRDAWHTNPWSLGSYAYLPIGYATTLFGIERVREGACFFAGEHTAAKAADCGYLNAAVVTGQRAARQVLDSLTCLGTWPGP